jgi:hypothetical protein
MIDSKAKEYRACASVNGYFGYVPEPAHTDDLIVMFANAQVPFVISPTEHSRYKLLGPAYIQGIMKGEYTK